MSEAEISTKPVARRSARDPRLDFFRGIGMFIILYAHIPGSEFSNWIPARFGFSDATEIFVFCSGVATSYAFGSIFVKQGWFIGATRIAFRVWQVFWAHVGVFVVIVAALTFIDAHLHTFYARNELNLAPFLDNPADLLWRYLTLTYVPNFFDILPMYLVLLAMVPLVMLIAPRSIPLTAVLLLALWSAANLHWLELPAEPWSTRPWYFNPFAWQLVFFTGFGFGMRYLPAPPVDRRLIIAAIAVITLAAPFSCHYGFACYGLWGASTTIEDVHEALNVTLIDKTHLGAFRYVHFVALAYLVWIAAGEGGRNLRGWFVEAMMRVGRQTLAVFLSGLVIARLMGVVLDQAGGSTAAQIGVNVGGSLALYVVAIAVDWFKSAGKQPPARRKRDASASVVDGAMASRESHVAPAQ